METLQEIKEKYAIEQGFPDWDDLWHAHIYELLDFEIVMNEICIRAQKAALEKAAEKGCDSLELFNSEYDILSKAITNEQNLIR